MFAKIKQNISQYLTNYIFLLWDGVGFFGFDDNKLERLKGKKPKWYDRFSNKRWLAANLVVILAMLQVLGDQYHILGTVKKQILNSEK